MNVVLTLTTIPSRLTNNYGYSGIRSCLDSINNQNYDDYEIHFNIPYANKHSGEQYNIPDWIHLYKKLKIFRVDDIGPATKLVTTVARVKNPEDIIIVVDDDLVYHPDMILAHLSNQTKWEDAVVGYDGIRSRDSDGNFATNFNDIRDHYFSSHYFSSRVDILQHYKSVSYKRRYFEDDFEDFIMKYHSWHDDFLIAAYFASKKRDRVVEAHPLIPRIETLDEWRLIGGVTTFPVISHTAHDSYEGCNIFRQTDVFDNSSKLFEFIDNGYIKGN